MKTRKNLFVLGLFLMALVVPCWSMALTTFGKSASTNTQNNQNNQNNDKQNGDRITARECSSDYECSAIKGTTCLDPIFTNDDKKRCLCGDYKEPKNGRCENQYISVKVLCNRDEECTPGAICTTGNSTTLTGKRCWCMKGFSVDDDMLCNGSPATIGFSAMTLVASLLLARSL